MTSLIESASAILSGAESRLEVIAQNVTNASTPGYRRLVSFETLMNGPVSSEVLPTLSVVPDNRTGQLVSTDNPLDLALAGPGTFLVSDGRRLAMTRGGSFQRDGEGRLIDPMGRALQQSGGGDLIIEAGTLTVGTDGIIMIDGQPTGKIGVFHDSENGRGLSALVSRSIDAMQDEMPEEVDDPRVRQGVVEQSNVELGSEMISMMAISRSAESGARLVQTYDELIGRVLSSLGQSVR